MLEVKVIEWSPIHLNIMFSETSIELYLKIVFLLFIINFLS